MTAEPKSQSSTPGAPPPPAASLLQWALVALLLAAPSRAFADSKADASPESTEKAPKPSASDSYFEAGLELNLFTYANLTLGYWFGHIGARITGGYIADDSNDVRFDLGYKFFDNGRWRHATHLVVGRTEGSDPGADYNYAYVGLAYELNYRGFYVELGLGKDFVDRIGNLDKDPVVPVGTLLGYLYQFR
jgi:hypothetical protein